MNKYRTLIYNTFIFALGTFSSKLLVFFLLPLYTRVLTNADYGVVDLIVQTANLLIPIMSLGIANGVIRFGLDKSNSSSDVFSAGLFTILGGFTLFLVLWPLLSNIKYISGYTSLIYIFILMSSLRSLCSQFIRSKQLVRLYSFDGVLSTITTIAFNILYLVVFKLGINGYIYAIISSDFLSVLFLFNAAKLHRFIKLKPRKKSTFANMIKYSVPLIPSTIFWWITNVSDRYIVAYMLGAEANGLYAISYKIPTLITLLSSIFTEAWQLSAVSEKDAEYREHFFTNVFKAYSSLVFVSASVLILFAKVITRVLVSSTFYASWQYVPFLVMATSFSCLATFLGSIYFVEKKSNLSLITTFIGALINIVLNFIMIPNFGVNGAGFATFVSYGAVFVLRSTNTRKFIKINFSSTRLLSNTAILIVQSLTMIFEIRHWIFYGSICFIIMLLINSKDLIANARRLIK